MLTKAYEDASGINPKLSYGLPAFYDLHKDPEEKHPWVPENAGHFWVRWPMAEIMGEHLKSLQEEPPIKPGTPDPYVPAKK